MSQLVYCPCGKPLHYSDPIKQAAVEQQVALLGADVPVRLGNRTWLISRHFVALHPMKASDLPNSKFPELLADAMILPYLHDVGGARVSLMAPVYEDQVFSHNDDGLIRHFHILKLTRAIAQNKSSVEQGEFPIDADHVQIVKENRGIEEQHLALRMTDAFIEKPGIICLFSDDSQLIVDGHHRLVKRAELGKETMMFWCVPEKIWRKSLVRVPAQFDPI